MTNASSDERCATAQPKRRTQPASAVIYADIKGYTRMMSTIETLHADVRLRKMKRFVNAWTSLRDSLARPKTKYRSFYLANRIGDAFVILVFTPRPQLWYEYIKDHLLPGFDQVSKAIGHITQNNAAHPKLKVSIYSNGIQNTVYYETDVMAPQVKGGQTIAARDYFCTAMNKCARMDALEEADDAILICNEKVHALMDQHKSPGECFEEIIIKNQFKGFEHEPQEKYFALKGPSGTRSQA